MHQSKAGWQQDDSANGHNAVMTYLPTLRGIQPSPFFTGERRGRVTQSAWFLYQGYLHNNWLFEEWASAQAQRNMHYDVIMWSMVKKNNN